MREYRDRRQRPQTSKTEMRRSAFPTGRVTIINRNLGVSAPSNTHEYRCPWVREETPAKWLNNALSRAPQQVLNIQLAYIFLEYIFQVFRVAILCENSSSSSQSHLSLSSIHRRNILQSAIESVFQHPLLVFQPIALLYSYTCRGNVLQPQLTRLQIDLYSHFYNPTTASLAFPLICLVNLFLSIWHIMTDTQTAVTSEELKFDIHSKENQWYFKDIGPHIQPNSRRLLEEYSHFPPEHVDAHIYKMVNHPFFSVSLSRPN